MLARGEAAPSNGWPLLLLSGRVVSRAGMDVLWAPWRMAYIGDRTPTGCIFCAACEGDPRERLLLGMSRASLVMLNRFPYQSAHLMIAPRRHTADLPGLPALDEEATEASADLLPPQVSERAARMEPAAVRSALRLAHSLSPFALPALVEDVEVGG